MHLNGVFLEPDDTRWDAHAASWNDNCVFCHNTGVQPRMEASERRFATRVADLGIACEACHGPGEEHVRRMASPLARLAPESGTLAIVNPSELAQAESLALCGQCHSQRLPVPGLGSPKVALLQSIGAVTARGALQRLPQGSPYRTSAGKLPGAQRPFSFAHCCHGACASARNAKRPSARIAMILVMGQPCVEVRTMGWLRWSARPRCLF